MNDDNNKKPFTNFDDFMNATAPENVPIHKRQVNRDEDGTFAENFAKNINSEDVLATPTQAAKFSDLFPELSVDGEVVKDLFWDAEDIYEKIMAVCMFAAVAAIFNPVLSLGYAFASGDAIRGGFGFFLVAFFLFCFIAVKKSFHLIGLSLIAVAKLLYFREGVGDVMLALAMFATIYLMFNIKKRKDEEIAREGGKAAREAFGDDEDEESEEESESEESEEEEDNDDNDK
jgi:hypothetical protein